MCGVKEPIFRWFLEKKRILKVCQNKAPILFLILTCSASGMDVGTCWEQVWHTRACFCPPFLYPTKQKQKHQDSIFLLYSPQRAQWAQASIQNSSKHSRCESVLLNFQPEFSSIFMCLYENSTIWMMEHKPLSHPSVVARMLARGHKGDRRWCFWGRRQVVVFWNGTNGGKRTAVLSGDQGETSEVRRRRRRDRRRSG